MCKLSSISTSKIWLKRRGLWLLRCIVGSECTVFAHGFSKSFVFIYFSWHFLCLILYCCTVISDVGKWAAVFRIDPDVFKWVIMSYFFNEIATQSMGSPVRVSLLPRWYCMCVHVCLSVKIFLPIYMQSCFICVLKWMILYAALSFVSTWCRSRPFSQKKGKYLKEEVVAWNDMSSERTKNKTWRCMSIAIVMCI